MNQTPSTAASRRPTSGLIAQTLGIVGAIACAALIVGVLVGKGWVQDRVDVLSRGAVKALDGAIAVSDDALVGLAAGAADAEEMRVAAGSLASSPTIDTVALTALQDRLSPLATRYQGARDRYVVLREKASSVIDTVQRIDRLLPGIDLPEGPFEFVAGMDEKLVDLDAAVTGLSSAAQSKVVATTTATTIAEQASRLEQGIVAATTLTQQVQTGLIDLQDDVDGLGDRVGSLVGLGSIALAIILAWVALLHVALWALGRRWRAA